MKTQSKVFSAKGRVVASEHTARSTPLARARRSMRSVRSTATVLACGTPPATSVENTPRPVAKTGRFAATPFPPPVHPKGKDAGNKVIARSDGAKHRTHQAQILP